jgi:hypothetical protein
MKEVQFSHREGDYLILKGEDGSQLRLELDGNLRQAVRSPNADAQTFSPGEVQSLIRSGLSIQEVANQLNVEEDSIEPFAAPVIAELNYIKSAALSVLVVAQDFDETVPFENLLESKLLNATIKVLKDDGSWVLKAENQSSTASFSFDPKNNWLKPLDDKARDIFEEQTPAVAFSVIDSPSDTEDVTEQEQPESDASSVATDLLEELQRRRAQKEADVDKPKPESSSKRPSLPSWDEIVFGAGENHDDKED